MNRKYVVALDNEARSQIQAILIGDTAPESIKKRANVLLLSDVSVGKPLTQAQIAARCGVYIDTVTNTVRDYCQYGLEYTLKFKRTKATNPPIVTGDVEARIITLACGAPPDGRSRWTVRLLTDKIVELDILDKVSRETVRNTLKKRNLSLT